MQYLRRKEAAEFLADSGYPVAEATLAKFASVGGGPRFRRFGRFPIYEKTDLLTWAEERAGKKVNSTAEYEAA
ncbi:MAG: DNA-binding protein [Alphaproteobacteria bacterium]